ncbi:MAG: hypothetical protein MK179_10295 [Pirellulaceae bacterium]|nr:hypothetical protein [Pirellulaceae bacterium]
MSPTCARKLVGILGLLMGWLLVPNAPAVELDSLVTADLAFEARPDLAAFHPRLLPLWSAALDRPEIELQQEAARAIVKAHQTGMEGLESTVPRLMQLLSGEKLPDDASYDLAQALIELDITSAADLLMQLRKDSRLPLTLLIEPALARWDYEPMRDVWLNRLQQTNVDTTRLALAIDGLRKVQASQASEPLRRLVSDSQQSSEIRLKAANALGFLSHEGLEPLVQELLHLPDHKENGAPPTGSSVSATLLHQLLCVRLLRFHASNEAIELLLFLATNDNGGVAALALERLLEIDGSLVTPINDQLVHHMDSNVRRLTGRALTQQATVNAVILLHELLDDPIPDIRIQTADQMVALDAQADLSESVRSSAMDMMASGKPRGVEQAIMVLGAVDHEPAADQMVSLLTSKTPEIAVASAWGLRKLQVDDTSKPMLDHLSAEMKRTAELDAELWITWKQTPPPTVDFDGLQVTYQQLQQLMQALSLLQYTEARELFEQHLPTPPVRGLGDPPAVAAVFHPDTRAAAIWALGHIALDDRTEMVTNRLVEILNSVPPSGAAETSVTRAAAAISLGSQEVTSALPSLRNHLGPLPAHEQVGFACGRVLHVLAGEPLPVSSPRTVYQLGWFLEPIEPPDAE